MMGLLHTPFDVKFYGIPIHHFHRDLNGSYLLFPFGRLLYPGEIGNIGYAKFGGKESALWSW